MIKLTEELIRDVSEKAKVSSRKRVNYNFHKSYDAVVQRLLNAAEPGTYIQPHKHENPDKNEVFIMLKGSVVVVEFDHSGNVSDHVVLDPLSGAKAAEIPPGRWHSFIVLKPGSVIYEVKEGPYDEKADKLFAPWAPSEGSPGADEFNKKILTKLNLNE